GVIISDRHIHVSSNWAERWGLKDQQIVSCLAGGKGPKPIILKNVRLRVSPKFVVEAHLDTDDANAACVNSEDVLEVIVP
ncbi:MAG: PduL/EutD family phosphate acyltransferase, partial [Candidatus Sumerlaeota bacterium]|nr:PduL/EutD family phosphate acyltransferase [Candidatus Sumerlaeota bacterium]